MQSRPTPPKSRPPMSHRKSDLGIPCPRKICQSSASTCRRERAVTAFFITSDNPETDLQRCHESQKFLSRLVITGATEQGEIKLFEGVVQSIEDHGENAPRGRRWRVLMIDEL